ANAGKRVAALHCLRGWLAEKARSRVVLVASAEAAVRLLPPSASFDDAPPHMKPGDPIDVEAFAARLEAIGYLDDDRVDEPGEMAVRGQVIDVFPADAAQPVRIEHADGRVTELRAYDPVSQRGTDTIERLSFGRACEPPLGEDAAPIFAHLPDAAIWLDPGAEAQRDRFLALAADSNADKGMLSAAAWESALAKRDRQTVDAGGVEPGTRYVETRSAYKAFAADAAAMLDGKGSVVLAGAPRDLRFLARRLTDFTVEQAEDWHAVAKARKAGFVQLAWPLDRGWRENGRLVVAAADLIGSRALAEGSAASSHDPLRGGPAALRLGDVVVHEDFGIGVVAGLETLPEAGDAIVLEYADEGRRLVPIDEADRIWRYGADRDAVTLDRLDGASWQKRRGAIDQAVAESARQLTQLAEERAGRSAPVLKPPRARYERFAAGFPFAETPDQLRAIADVLSDLSAGAPMDRLVVGDVGYGKTEVALRAAAAAALAGHQVIVAAPTTVLVRQHL
ncbi:MAG: DEAD/DEAH box helicase, partial [Staphylococcus hominis]